MNFDHADHDQMKRIQREVETTLQPWQQTEAAIVAFALVRVARTFLRLYPERTRQVLLTEVVIPYLRGDTTEPPNQNGASRFLIS